MTFLKLSHYSIRLAIRSDNLLFDGAYDGKPTYDAIIDDSGAAAIVIPASRQRGQPIDDGRLGQRDRHIAAISSGGQMKWQGSRG
ncbi:transposase [Rhizobium sp. SG741]|nr:transposase [Rhizobium sp. SG741]